VKQPAGVHTTTRTKSGKRATDEWPEDVNDFVFWTTIEVVDVKNDAVNSGRSLSSATVVVGLPADVPVEFLLDFLSHLS